MQIDARIAQHDIVTFRAPRGTAGHHSFVIVSGAKERTVDLESILATASRRGLDKIARVLRQRIVERDQQLIESAHAAIDSDAALTGALVELTVHLGALRCHAFIEPEHEDELIRVLGRIPGVRQVALEVVIAPAEAQA